MIRVKQSRTLYRRLRTLHPFLKKSEMIKTIIFDIDGTLYDYDAANEAAAEAVIRYAAENLGLSETEFNDALGRASRQLNHAVGKTAASHNRLIRYSFILEEASLSLVHAIRMEELYWDTLLDHAVLYDGVKETLKSLKQQGYKLGIGSNMTAYMQYRKLEKFGILQFFDFIVTSEETGCEKPASELFLRCAELAGNLPSECLYVGDSLKNDIEGAKAAGMFSLLIKAKRSYKRTNDAIISADHITKIGDMIDKFNFKIYE